MSYFPKPSLNENDLAIIERGDTAAHSIEAGQYVSWHGKTGKAKAAILQGATLDDTLFDYEESGTLNALNASLIDKITLSGKQKPATYTSVSPGGSYTIPEDGFYSCTVDAGNTGVYATWSYDQNAGDVGFFMASNSGTLVTTLYFLKGTVLYTRNRSGQSYNISGPWY